MPKQLRTTKITASSTLTAGEVSRWLSQSYKDTDPVLMKCGGRNYTIVGIKTVKSIPVFMGRRGSTK